MHAVSHNPIQETRVTSHEAPSPFQLEGITSDGDAWVIPVEGSPFVIGRTEGVQFRLVAPGVSRHHARLLEAGDGWWISDCGSTNGTYVNGVRLVDDRRLALGDHIAIAGLQFTVAERGGLEESTRIFNPLGIHLELLLGQRAVVPHYQPIVSFSDGSVVGHELLGRIAYEGLPNDPGKLFEIARKQGREIALSALFRDAGLEHAAGRNLAGLLLFNTHPKEMNLESLHASLSSAREAAPRLALGMELHENAVTDLPMMLELRQMLSQLDIQLVYDDFGAGQARLTQLLDTTPDILKFDLAFVRNIHLRAEVSRSIVGALVLMAKNAGIRTLAEGIECAEEAEVCRALGFDLAQGYYFGRPAPL